VAKKQNGRFGVDVIGACRFCQLISLFLTPAVVFIGFTENGSFGKPL
jgi:hypothetical protein